MPTLRTTSGPRPTTSGSRSVARAAALDELGGAIALLRPADEADRLGRVPSRTARLARAPAARTEARCCRPPDGRRAAGGRPRATCRAEQRLQPRLEPRRDHRAAPPPQKIPWWQSTSCAPSRSAASNSSRWAETPVTTSSTSPPPAPGGRSARSPRTRARRGDRRGTRRSASLLGHRAAASLLQLERLERQVAGGGDLLGAVGRRLAVHEVLDVTVEDRDRRGSKRRRAPRARSRTRARAARRSWCASPSARSPASWLKSVSASRLTRFRLSLVTSVSRSKRWTAITFVSSIPTPPVAVAALPAERLNSISSRACEVLRVLEGEVDPVGLERARWTRRPGSAGAADDESSSSPPQPAAVRARSASVSVTGRRLMVGPVREGLRWDPGGLRVKHTAGRRE